MSTEINEAFEDDALVDALLNIVKSENKKKERKLIDRNFSSLSLALFNGEENLIAFSQELARIDPSIKRAKREQIIDKASQKFSKLPPNTDKPTPKDVTEKVKDEALNQFLNESERQDFNLSF